MSMPELPRHRVRLRGSRAAVGEPAYERQPEAAEALRFIRDTMQQAGAFTAISGRGLIIMGLTALLASAIASRQSYEGWLAVWMAEVLMAALIAGFTIYRKAIATGTPLFSGPARKVAMGLLPAMAAGAVLTAVFYFTGRPEFVAPMWLLLYGVGVMAGGAWSVAAVPVMGLVFMVIALPAFVITRWPDAWMALGFGLTHIIFGIVVTKKYGG
jgi:hypothetical protein